MSSDAVQSVLHELESLPESDQQRVLDFLARLKQQHALKADVCVTATSPALVSKEGLLVFTGRVDTLEIDWIQLAREERDRELMEAALGTVPQG